MLEQDDGVAALLPPPSALRPPDLLEPDERPAEMWDRMVEQALERERERQERDYAMASYEWEIALEQSRMAPPDARFASRIRHIALAASRRAAAIRECMEDPAFVWEPIPDPAGMALSYELRPGGTRPGPKDAWDRVDRVVTRLGIAVEGDSGSAVASALRDLSSAMTGVADAIENRPARAPLADGAAELPQPDAE
jgi:hypothetical protein